MQTTHDLYTVYMQQAEERPMQQAPVPDKLRVLESAYAFFQPVVLPPRAVRPRMKDATTQTPTINHTTTQAGDLLSLLEVAKMSSKATRDVLSSVRSSKSFRSSVDVLGGVLPRAATYLTAYISGRTPLSPMKNLQPATLKMQRANKKQRIVGNAPSTHSEALGIPVFSFPVRLPRCVG